MEPERLLFLHVVIQAIEDLSSAKVAEFGDILARHQAYVWFRDNSVDYQEVCLCANIDSQQLRKNVLKAKPVQLRNLINEYRKLM